MREIKFRAWDNVKDQMYFVGEEEDVAFEIVGGKFVGYDAREDLDAPCFKMEHLEIMQYTGLKDKNDVEIYEGDVVNVNKPWIKPRIEVVNFYTAGGKTGVHPFTDTEHQWTSYTAEVIGNIYEHPHLLGVSE